MRPVVFSALALASCGLFKKPHQPPWHDAHAEATRMLTLLPKVLAGFDAKEPGRIVLDGKRIVVRGVYTSADGRSATIELVGGDMGPEHAILGNDDEHSLGKDSPDYWRTTSTRGFRTRSAATKDLSRSETFVQTDYDHVVDVVVTPAKAGESEALAALVDLETLRGP